MILLNFGRVFSLLWNCCGFKSTIGPTSSARLCLTGTRHWLKHNIMSSVASLGWVTPGVATEGVTPLFFPEKPGDLFLLIAVTITIAFYCFHSGVTPLEGVTIHLFYLSDLVSPLFFVNLPTKIFFLRVSPPGGCHPARSP